jgi:hypothetical protein
VIEPSGDALIPHLNKWALVPVVFTTKSLVLKPDTRLRRVRAGLDRQRRGERGSGVERSDDPDRVVAGGAPP